MTRARVLAVTILLLSYGAVGARQPAVRVAVPLPVPARTLANALRLSTADSSTILVDAVRALNEGSEDDKRRRAALQRILRTSLAGRTDWVVLALDPSIWRDTILHRPIADSQIPAVVLSDRRAGLLFAGLAALDDETLGWLGPDRETLVRLREHAPIFAAVSRS